MRRDRLKPFGFVFVIGRDRIAGSPVPHFYCLEKRFLFEVRMMTTMMIKSNLGMRKRDVAEIQ